MPPEHRSRGAAVLPAIGSGGALGALAQRQLRQHHGGKDQRAADALPRREALVQDEPAANGAEDAFQTHDEAGDGGVQVFLAQNLQRVGHAAGKDAAEHDGPGVGCKIGQGGRLKQERGKGALDGRDQELQQAQADTVHQRGVVVHRHDLEAEQHGAAQQQPVAELHAAKAVFHAEQVEPGHRDDHAHPEPRAVPPPQCQPEHRHQHHIHGSEETGLGRGGVEDDAHLLGCRGKEEERAADDACGQQGLAVLFGLGPAVGGTCPAVERVKHIHGGNQHQHSQPAAPGQERIGSHAGAGALCHEREAPDKGAEHQQQ